MIPAPLPSRYGARPGRVLWGDVAGRLGEEVRDLGLRRVGLVSDPGVVAAGHAGRAAAALAAAGVAVQTFTDVAADPDLDAVISAARALVDVDGFVAVGGGAVIDTAKAASMWLAHGGTLETLRGAHKDGRPLRPVVALPTTAGTGSEAQCFALVSDPVSHRKVACGDPGAIPVLTLLDPGLTLSLPPQPTALSGLDALTHAVEARVTTVGTEASRDRAQAAFALLWDALPRVLATPADQAARAAMLRGAHLAGQAIEASMLGAAHAAGNPLTRARGVPHGAAVALMLPHVVRLNLAHPAATAGYRALARSVGLAGSAALADGLADRLALAGLPTRVSAWGLGAEERSALAAEAATQWTGGFNPVPLDAAGFEVLYRSAW